MTFRPHAQPVNGARTISRDSHRAVVSGAGVAGLLHALALRAHGMKVVAVFDPDRARAEALASVCDGARAVSSIEALAAVDADVACVCGPPHTHAAQAEVLARRAALVFVEKPVTTTSSDFERLARLPACVPIVQWRAGRAIAAVREAIACGELGPTPVVNADLAWSRDEAYFATGKGGRASWGCGALLSIGIHALDAILFALAKPVDDVTGVLGYRAGVELETSAVLCVALRGGALASVRLTLDGGPDTTRLSFCGRGVTLEIQGGEADPTASALHISTRDTLARTRLEVLEKNAVGSPAAPLLVPFIGGALDAAARGARPGEDPSLPSVASVRSAHAAIFEVYARWGQRAA